MFSLVIIMWVFVTIAGAIAMGWYQKFVTTKLRNNRVVMVTRIHTKTVTIATYVATIIFGILLTVRSAIAVVQMLSNQTSRGGLLTRSGFFMPFILAAVIYCYNLALSLAFNETSRIHEKMLGKAIRGLG